MTAAYDIDDRHVSNAEECLRRVGLWDLVESMRGEWDLADLLGPSRTPPRLCRVRYAIYAAAYEVRDGEGLRVHSLHELGRLFNRDHTTIAHGMRRYATAKRPRSRKR